jgi:hypothetical protein
VSDKDQYCCLLFHEVSIKENVHFNQKLDCIEGSEDYGTERTYTVTNGPHQKWKQPVAYYFSCRSTKAHRLVRLLNEVLGACQNAGLHVVATICVMGCEQHQGLQTVGC